MCFMIILMRRKGNINRLFPCKEKGGIRFRRGINIGAKVRAKCRKVLQGSKQTASKINVKFPRFGV